jgi:pimeloyl-ACP methyl ester carboxylesterase
VWLTDRIADLIASLGHEKAVIVGHDWGGVVAWQFPRFHPEKTAAVIGLNTPDLRRPPIPPIEAIKASGSSRGAYILGFQERGQAEAAFAADPRGFLSLFFRGPAAKNPNAVDDETFESYLDAFTQEGAITPPLEYYRNMDRNWELTAATADMPIEVPCLMISAADDPVLTPKMAEGMEERVPDLRKVVIEDCGHWTMHERPAEAADHIVSFLKELAPF